MVINEVSAANWDLLLADGEYEDWIELYNGGAATVDLTGYYLSDDDTQPAKWPIPAGVIIPAGGHLVFYASGKDGIIAGAPHTNFKLTQTKQEFVVFSDPSQNVLDQFWIEFPNQKNHSWGRNTDGAAAWSIFLLPTPASANAGATPYYEEAPVISPVAGGYVGSASVTITAAAGSTIRYTIDGTEPIATSPVFVGPINVAATQCIRAVAFSATPGVPPSFVGTSTYLINETHVVPIWSIAGGADILTILNNAGSPVIAEANIELFDAAQVIQDETFGEFNEHGGTSNSNDQRGIDYIVRDEFGYDHRIENQLFRGKSRDKFERIILKAAAGDNFPGYSGAHIRDAYVQSLSQKCGLKLDERTYEPCVLYVNGQYWGVYETREKVDDNDYTEYYHDQPGEQVDMIQQYGGVWADYGDVNGWWDLYNFIVNNDMTIPANYAQVQDTLNTLSMIDHMIINEYVANGSWLLYNTMWWRGKDPAGDHKKFGYALWDMDWILGSPQHEFGFPLSTPQNDPCDHETVVVGGTPSLGNMAGTHFAMFNALMANTDFKQHYLARYADLINTGLSCASTVGHLDSLIALIDPEMQRHCNRWGGTYAEWQLNVQGMRDFLLQRCAFIAQGIEDCYEVAPRDIVVMVDPPGSGMVHLNTLDLLNFPWNGVYFDSTGMEFTAEAYATYDFDHWSTNSHTPLPSTLDSAMHFLLLNTDTIVAHFRPEVQYAIVFDTEPHDAGSIRFGTNEWSTFPQTASVPEAVPFPLEAIPAEYYDFVRWEIRNNTVNLTSPSDPALDSVSITFFAPDTIIAHFKPHDYGYYVPNAFTPNNDHINDVWLPLGDRIDPDHYEVLVMDRWGERIFASTDLFLGWDGTWSGAPVPIGAYVYRISVRDAITQERHILQGSVSVVR